MGDILDNTIGNFRELFVEKNKDDKQERLTHSLSERKALHLRYT